tara:strand:+ start:515 stop:676 length:162 start_codon:yes stop_codon:yes gene_type:complete
VLLVLAVVNTGSLEVVVQELKIQLGEMVVDLEVLMQVVEMVRVIQILVMAIMD